MNVIVIPTYKEKETLKHNLPKLKRQIGKNDFILLMDNTKDFETKQFQQKRIKCFPIYERKKGYGKSLMDGLIIATYVFNADYIIQMDADHNPKDLKKFINNLPLKEEDFLIGYETKGRVIMRTVLRLLCKGLGFTFTQPSCGFRLFKNKVLRNLEWKKIKASGFDIQVEILYHLNQKHFKGLEIPISPNERRFDKSKFGLRQVMKYAFMLRRLFTKHLYISLISIIKGDKQ